MKQLFLRALAICMIGFSMITQGVSQFRSPVLSPRLYIELQYDRYCSFHPDDCHCPICPCEPILDKKNGKRDRRESEESCWWNNFAISPWGATYARVACWALPCAPDCCPPPSCSPCTPLATNCCKVQKRTSLGDLWFGKASFRGEEAFADGELSPTELGTAYNPFLGASLITPEMKYVEKGVILGFNTETIIRDDCWRLGLRVRLPYKSIEVTMERYAEEGVKDMAYIPSFVPNGCPEASSEDCDFAYRLDLLRGIMNYSTGVAPVTQVGNDGNAGPLDVGGASPDTLPIYLIERCNGDVPSVAEVTGADGVMRLGKVPEQVSGALPANGEGSDGQVFHFGAATVDYAANLCPDGQRQLFVVPNLEVVNPTTVQFNSAASPTVNDVASRINSLLGSLSQTPLTREFFAQQCGINVLDPDCTAGFGDLTTDLYASFCGDLRCSSYCVYGIFGLTYPTSKRVKDTGRVYATTAGNNGHVEIKVGVDAGATFEILGFSGALDTGYTYNHVVSAKENKAAPFTGARIRNIGPCVLADVSWHYHIFHADLTAYHARCPGVGISTGYELYAKSKDKVELCNDTTARDCFGRVKDLDPCILTACTDTLTHKIRAELSHAWDSCRLFIGGSYVFAGRSAMLETEAHIGLTSFF